MEPEAPTHQNDGDEDENEDTVDKPEPILPKKPVRNVSKDVTEQEQTKARKILKMVVDAMTSEEYLKNREPRSLSDFSDVM